MSKNIKLLMIIIFFGAMGDGVFAFPLDEKEIAREFKGSRLAQSIRTAIGNISGSTVGDHPSLEYYDGLFHPNHNFAHEITLRSLQARAEGANFFKQGL